MNSQSQNKMKSSNNYSIIKVINLLIYCFPLSFILGNFIVNLTVFFISLLGIIHYKNKIFDFKKNNPLNLIIVFFVLVFLSTLFEFIKFKDTGFILKSVLFFRFLLFLLVIRALLLNDDINLKKFFLSCIFFSSFVSIDIIFQYFVGVDFFGNKPEHFHSGLFGDEAIAGGYIQRFSIIGCFAIPWLFDKKYKKSFSIFFLLLSICFLGTLLSGNRMPVIMFLLFFFLISIIFSIKKINYVINIITFLVFFVFVLILNNNQEIKGRYNSFLMGMPKVSVIVSELKKDYPQLEKYKNISSWPSLKETEEFKEIIKDKSSNLPMSTGHTQVYITSLDLFMDNPIFGRGIKSFRYACYDKIHLPNRTCQSHPHNFHLEILNDVGIVGFITFFAALIILFFRNFKKYFIDYSRGNLNLIFYSIFLALLIEFIPIRSTGSFFSVWNAAYVFFLIGIFFGLYDLKSQKSEKLNT